MKWMWIGLICLPVWATEDINFVTLKIQEKGSNVGITAEIEPLLDYKLLRDPEYTLDKNTYDLILDGSLRQTAFMLRTMERNRGTIMPPGVNELTILSFELKLAMRKDTGDIIQKREYKCEVGLDKEPDTGVIICKDEGIRHTFPISTLTEAASYREFVKMLVFPQQEITMNKPAGSEYLVDLYYGWPRSQVKDQSLIDIFPSIIMWDKGNIKKLDIHLGTTYAWKKDDQWQYEESGYFKSYRDSIKNYTRVLEALEEKDTYEVIPMLEDYIRLVPGDKKALKLLMDLYLEENKNTEAYDLISRFEPFFATIRGGVANKKDLARKAERKRNLLVGKKGDFTRNNDVTLEITSPVDGDLVTGTTDLEFTLVGHEAKILEIECYLDDELIARITADQGAYKVPFSLGRAVGFKNIEVTAWFEDETYQRDQVRIRTIRVDEEQRVGLVTLQATVFQTDYKESRPLAKEDFDIRENKKKVTIENFFKNESPLRIVILIDTSISMVGEKLHATQYAIKTFLSKLQEEDKVAVYTFDSNILKVSDFTNDFADISPQLMTLSPHGATSLYDAMLVAHDEVMGQNGTKVVIVLSDGEDSDSATTDIHVSKLIQNSPVIVYSIVLPSKFLGNSSTGGTRFLMEMARLSGSVSTRLRDVKKLSGTFDQIYQDLKNLYYMDYYSDIPNVDKRDVRIKVNRPRAKVRFRAIN